MDAKQMQEMKQSGQIVNLQGKDYITHEGLKALVDARHGKDKWTLQVHVPSTEESSIIRQMVGMDGKADPYIVLKGEVHIEGRERPFVAWGSAHAGNLKGYITMATFPFEMAGTRAANRAMRLAAGASMTSVDELPEGYNTGRQQGPQQQQRPQYPPAAQQQTQSGGPKLASDKQRNMLRYLVKSDKLSDTQRANLQAAIDNETLAIGQASALINKAKAVVDGEGGGDTDGEALATDQQLAALSKIAYDSQNGLSDSQRADLAKTLRDNDQAKGLTEAAASALIDEFTKAAAA